MSFFLIRILVFFCVTSPVEVKAAIIYQNLYNDNSMGSFTVRTTPPGENKPPSMCCPPVPYTSATSLRHSATLVTTPTRAGAGAVKMTLKGTDEGFLYGTHADPYNRTEFEKSLGTYAGLTRWYGFSVYIDPSYADSQNNNAAVFQAHQLPSAGDACDQISGPPLLLLFDPSPLQWIVRSDSDATACSTTSSRVRQTYTTPASKGVWTDFVIQAAWSSGASGLLKVWKNGVLWVNQTGPNIYNNTGSTQNMKWGMYNALWGVTAPAATDVITLCYDQLRVGDGNSSFAEVDPAQGGGPQIPAIVTAYKYTGIPSSDSWANVPKLTMTAPTYLNEGTVNNDTDLSTDVQVLWDTTALHFRAVVSDETLVRDSGENAFHDDSVVWWLNKGAPLRLLISYNGTAIVLEGTCTTHNFSATGITGGYEIRGSIPKTCFGNPTLAADLDIDFLFQLNDDDNTGNRDARFVIPVTPAVPTFTSPVILRLSNTTVNLGSPGAPIISNIQVPAATLTATTATVTWDTNEDTTSNVDYDTKSGEPYLYSAPTPADTTVAASPHAVTLSGLAPSLTYYVRPRSTNTAGVETEGSEVSFTTPAVSAATTIQVEVQIRSLFGSEVTAIPREGRSAQLGGSFRSRFELLVQNANLGATGFIPYFTIDGGPATVLGSSCLTSAVCAYRGAKTLDVTDGDQTTQQLSVGSYVAGQVKVLAQPISLAIAQNQSTELEWAVSLSDTLLAGNEQVCLVLRKEGGGTLNSATPLCLTVVNSQAGTDGVVQ